VRGFPCQIEEYFFQELTRVLLEWSKSVRKKGRQGKNKVMLREKGVKERGEVESDA